ncbi:MAG: metallophosphoesterase family protein [Polyangiaceae bacterium]
MRFLCVSDIHGHRAALEAVLAEAAEGGFDQLLVCGDLLFPGPEPLETWRLLLKHHAVCVQGVGDRAVYEVDPSRLRGSSPETEARIQRLAQVHKELGELIIARLGKLPTSARLPLEDGSELVLVHGSPADPTECFTSDMTEDELLALVGDDPADLIVCGGSHELFQREVEGVRIVSVGSVGEAPGGGYATGVIIESSPLGTTIAELNVTLHD